MARCTKEEAQETRHRILDAAADVFHQNGVSHTSLADIALAAGVTRGAIYWHFKNKDELFDAMCERVCLPIDAMMELRLKECADDPLGQLRTLCLHVLREAIGNAHARKVFGILFHRCEYIEASGFIMNRQQENFLKGTNNIKHFLTLAVERQQLPADLDIPLAANLFHGNWSGLLSNWLFAPDSFDLAHDAERFVDAWIDNLQRAPSLRR